MHQCNFVRSTFRDREGRAFDLFFTLLFGEERKRIYSVSMFFSVSFPFFDLVNNGMLSTYLSFPCHRFILLLEKGKEKLHFCYSFFSRKEFRRDFVGRFWNHYWVVTLFSLSLSFLLFLLLLFSLCYLSIRGRWVDDCMSPSIDLVLDSVYNFWLYFGEREAFATFFCFCFCFPHSLPFSWISTSSRDYLPV